MLLAWCECVVAGGRLSSGSTESDGAALDFDCDLELALDVIAFLESNGWIS